MTPLSNAIYRVIQLAGLYSLIFLCSPCLLLRYLFGPKRRSRCGGVFEAIPPSYPDPLPIDRIDILRTEPPAPQPATCALLQLPAELRALVFEAALAYRVIHIKMEPDANYAHYLVRSTCYAPLNEADRSLALLPTDKIAVGLLGTCKQVYIEALHLFLQRNTFYFYVDDFEPAMKCGLGLHCLPDIRHLFLFYRGHAWAWTQHWHPVFSLLSQMRLNNLTVEIKDLFWTELHPNKFSVNNPWSRSLLTIRNLREVVIFFDNPPDHPVHRENVNQELQELMVGPNADEKYNTLLAAERSNAE